MFTLSKCYSAGTDFTKFQEKKICPECSSLMFLLNEKFKAPLKCDSTQWEIVKMLIDNCFHYQTIFDPITNENVPYPWTKKEAEEFIQKYAK